MQWKRKLPVLPTGNDNDKIVVLDADLAGATMTQYFKKAHPDRFFDCGIAELTWWIWLPV